MPSQIKQPRFAVLTALVAAAATLRLLPHLPNFSPIGAMALFAGASFTDRRAAFAVPFAALLISDCLLGGFYAGMPVVYAAFAGVVCVGFWLRSGQTALRVAIASLASSLFFFVVTNLGLWLSNTLYPRTAGGLAECFVVAVPFFRYTAAGDLCYAALLFGAFALAQRRFPALRAA